jgi:uncharacterized protein (DUF486 family)
MPGIGELMEGAMQQAPQPARHSMKTSHVLGGRDLNAWAPRLPSPRLGHGTWPVARSSLGLLFSTHENNAMPVWMQTAALLTLSNIFMTFAWYGHLKTMNSKPWLVAALVSWGIALFEYLIMVPANRIGYTEMSVGQLKIMQEVITLAVFVPFSVYVMQQPLKLDYLWAGLCLLGAVYFIFRA